MRTVSPAAEVASIAGSQQTRRAVPVRSPMTAVVIVPPVPSRRVNSRGSPIPRIRTTRSPVPTGDAQVRSVSTGQSMSTVDFRRARAVTLPPRGASRPITSSTSPGSISATAPAFSSQRVTSIRPEASPRRRVARTPVSPSRRVNSSGSAAESTFPKKETIEGPGTMPVICRW